MALTSAPSPRAIIVIGVSGAGKSCLARALAAATGYAFIEGDDLHPPANVAKMAAGIALDDADRWPWLDRLADALAGAVRAGEGGVATCSALKRSYRDRLRARVAIPVVFVHPVIDRDMLVARLRARTGHFMPVSLLDSQLATFEPPAPDEPVIAVDAGTRVDTMVAAVLAALRNAVAHKLTTPSSAS